MIVVELETEKLAELPPNATPVVVKPEPLKLVPWIVTAGGPPASGPESGVTDVIVGAACWTTNWSFDDVVEVPPGVVTTVSY
jgi:hypothetical protein